MDEAKFDIWLDLAKTETGEIVRFYWSDPESYVWVLHFSHGKLATSDKLEIKQARLCWKDLVRTGFTRLTPDPVHK